MEYEDFCVLLIPRGEEGEEVEARILRAPFDAVPEKRFELPFDGELRRTLLGLASKEERVEVNPRTVGKGLFAALFQGEIASLWSRSLVLADERKRGLRLRLAFDMNHRGVDIVSGYPWEMLCNPVTGEYLADDRSRPVVRQLFVDRVQPTLELTAPLRVLVVAAKPEGDEVISVDEEVGKIESVLSELREKGRVQVVRAEPTANGMRDALLDGPVHVLHLISHGGYRPERWLGWVSMVDAEGKERYVIGERYAALLRGIPDLRLVVLNACSTARHGSRTANGFQGMASAILERTGVAAVLAHQTSIGDAAAVELSQVLYGRLAKGDPVDAAVSEARLRLSLEGDEWATPVLFLNSKDGRLFRVEERPAVAQANRAGSAAGPAVKDAKAVLRLGIRSFHGYGDDMEDHTDELLDLKECFDPNSPDGRFIIKQEWWQERVFPAVRDFLYPFRVERRPILLDLAAHVSIAFAAGWVLEAKSGLEIGIRQRSHGRPLEWWPNDGRLPGEGESLWQGLGDRELDGAAADRALAVAISNPEVIEHATEFVTREQLPVGRILDLRISPEPHSRAVKGGEHALLLAQGLVPRIRERRLHERDGALHLFPSAPNAFLVYLGQLSRSFGRVVLYEHPFGVPGAESRYQRSIELPPPGEGFELPAGW